MKRIAIYLLMILVISCKPNDKQNANKAWVALWNGSDLTGWHSYLGTLYNKEVDSLGNKLVPFGIDNDPLGIIKVVETDEGNAIRISGLVWGMIYTEKDYSNYHLKLKVKWGEAMHPPREKGPRDSGLLYHGFGKPGSVYNWMASQELQIQQGDMGDYWPTGDVEIDVPSKLRDSLFYQYDEKSKLRTYYFAEILEEASLDSLAKRRVMKSMDKENPHGEWNEIELVCFGDSSVHIVNGSVVMRLFNSRKMSDKSPLTSGKIILQSEGAEVFYKDIFIKEIADMPLLNYNNNTP